MFVGIGRKLRIDVGGNVVDVKIGRLVERVCVDVVGCVLEFTRACGVSGPLFTFSVDPVVDEEVFAVVSLVCVPVCGTGTEMFALMMCTSALGWLAFISD